MKIGIKTRGRGAKKMKNNVEAKPSLGQATTKAEPVVFSQHWRPAFHRSPTTQTMRR